MEPERLELSTRARLKVLHEEKEGHLRQIEPAHRLPLERPLWDRLTLEDL